MRWQEILDRFRPVTAPGGAAESAEHVAARTGPAFELAPVFAALEQDLADAATLTADARRRAQDAVEQARRRAADVVARARQQAPGDEAAAAATVLERAAEEDDRVVGAARRRAEGLRASRSPRLEAAAGDVIERLLESVRDGS